MLQGKCNKKEMVQEALPVEGRIPEKEDNISS
jgi:hypothetical protein